MSPFIRVIGVLMFFGVPARAAGEGASRSPSTAVHAEEAEERVAVGVVSRAGLAEAPFVSSAFPEVSGFGVALMGEAGVRLSSQDWLRARVLMSVVGLDFPAGAQVVETALGNLELGLEHTVEMSGLTRLEFAAALIAPTAEHGPDTALLANRALALVNALNGGKDAALATPGVSGVRLGASLEHSSGPLQLGAVIGLPLLVRVSDASLPADTVSHPLGILPSVDLMAGFRVTSSFGLVMSGGLVTEPLRVQEPARERDRRRRLQPIVQPSLYLWPGQQVRLGLDGSIPIAGVLGGNAWSIGVYCRIGF